VPCIAASLHLNAVWNPCCSIEIRTGFPPGFFSLYQFSIKNLSSLSRCVKFFGVKNMSRCVKYQESRQGVGVGFCHCCHSVKMNQKHLDLLEYSRGPPHHVQTDTCLVSHHTYQWGPFVINDFSNLTNSLSPTPEQQYTGDGTANMSTRGVHVQKNEGLEKKVYNSKDRKEGTQTCICVGMGV